MGCTPLPVDGGVVGGVVVVGPLPTIGGNTEADADELPQPESAKAETPDRALIPSMAWRREIVFEF